MTESCECDTQVSLKFYPNISIDRQQSALCYNLVQLSKSQNNTAVKTILYEQAKALWRCNLKGKEGYDWDDVENWRFGVNTK